MRLFISGWSKAVKATLLENLKKMDSLTELVLLEQENHLSATRAWNKVQLIKGPIEDSLLIEGILKDVDQVLLFMPEAIRKDSNLEALLNATTSLLNLALFHRVEKFFIICEAHMRIEALNSDNTEEWRPTNQHSNWIRLQYLLWQEINRVNVENLSASIIWYAPENTDELYAAEGLPYQLTLTKADLADFIAQVLDLKGKPQNSYFLSCNPQKINTMNKPRKVSFWEKIGLVNKKERRDKHWNRLPQGNFTFNDFEHMMQRKPRD